MCDTTVTIHPKVYQYCSKYRSIACTHTRPAAMCLPAWATVKAGDVQADSYRLLKAWLQAGTTAGRNNHQHMALCCGQVVGSCSASIVRRAATSA